MKYLILAATVTLSGCASMSMGEVTRTEFKGQQTVCWTPSNHMNGFVQFVADHLGSVMAEPPGVQQQDDSVQNTGKLTKKLHSALAQSKVATK